MHKHLQYQYHNACIHARMVFCNRMYTWDSAHSGYCQCHNLCIHYARIAVYACTKCCARRVVCDMCMHGNLCSVGQGVYMHGILCTHEICRAGQTKIAGHTNYRSAISINVRLVHHYIGTRTCVICIHVSAKINMLCPWANIEAGSRGT